MQESKQAKSPRTSIWHVSRTHDPTDLLHALQIGREAAVHAEDLLVDNSSHRQAVEVIGKGLPKLDVIPTLALIVKAVDPVDRGALVVPPQQEKVFWVLDLV